jgi:sugar lactone lactonase YvrE
MRIAWAAVLFPPAILLSGCSSVPVTISNQTNPVHGAAISGKVHGGQNPIVGASVYLYAASTTGEGTASTSLLNSNVLSQTPAGGQDGSGNYYVTTDSNGAFSITGDYTCPSSTSQVYLYSVGGNAGSGSNSGIALMAALGTCPASGTLSSSLYVVINEVSTIATAYALNTFQKAGNTTDVGSSPRPLGLSNIANAFATVTNLEDLSTGEALATTPAGNGTVPQSEINTLANILAACVNSTGPTSTQCTTLFNNAKSGTVTTTNTAQAAVGMARIPGQDGTPLFNLQTANAPFQPSLTSVPGTFAIGINYTGGGLSNPYGGGIDASGNVWVVNSTGNSISEFSPLGAPISPDNTGFTGGGLSGPYGLAIDSSGNVWVTNYSGGAGASISKFSSSGVAISGSSGYTGGGLSGPNLLAIDKSGNVWVANHSASSISEFNSSGGAVSGSGGFTGGGLNAPLGVAIDVAGNVWAANNGADSISELTSSGSPISGSIGYTGGGLTQPGDLHIDGLGNVYASNFLANSLSELGSTGVANGNSPFLVGGLNAPEGIAIDAANSVWVANSAGNGITTTLNNGTSGSNPPGMQGGGLNAPFGIGIDGAGNIWVTNSGDNSITEFVGRTFGVVTPIVANLLAPYGSHAVNGP